MHEDFEKIEKGILEAIAAARGEGEPYVVYPISPAEASRVISARKSDADAVLRSKTESNNGVPPPDRTGL